jgi:hypothetical protein
VVALKLTTWIRMLCLAVFVAAFVTIVVPPTHAETCGGEVSSQVDALGTFVHCQTQPDGHGVHASSASNASDSTYSAIEWHLACGEAIGSAQAGGVPCSNANECPPGRQPFTKWGLLDGTWIELETVCQDEAPPGTPSVTPRLVARAFQRIPLPAFRAITQPADKTLINFDTIFRVEAAPLDRTVTLLWQRVDLRITPSTFRWVHGDGTTSVTTTPGAAYPAKDVVYRYERAHVTVMQHVEIVWTARWSLNGGPFQDVTGTVTTVGPATALRIAEATPALSGYGH